MTDRKHPGRPKLSLPVRRSAALIAALAAFLLPYLVTFEGLSPAGHRVFAIFLLAIVLWVTEAIPLHATAALIILLEIVTISNAALLPLPEGFTGPAYGSFYATLAHPVLMLFLGGFFLADGAAKYKLDRNLVSVLLKPFGTSPSRILLGLMVVTAMFSMFMSNTATTATMMAVVLPVIAGLPAGDRMRTGLALCIPFAANIGGMGTPVGTPPNAIALGALAKAGITISFLDWMLLAVPGMLIILFGAWVLLAKLYPSSTERMEVKLETSFDRSPKAMIFYATFGLTVLLWLTEPLHGVPSTIVGFLPVVLLLGTGVMNTKDMQSLQWHVLWLVAGGIALGQGVGASGLDTWLIGLVNWEVMPTALIGAALGLGALAMGSVISHSATANLLVPIGMTLATAGTVAVSPVMAAVAIAIGSSLAMPLPISTPPNAIAYSTGAVKTGQMALSGAIIGLAGWALFSFLAPYTWDWMNILP